MITVWTNGCFDVLHRGHIEMLKYAKSLGDILIVGIDTDSKVKKDKGPSRPFNTVKDRKFLLESIKYVDKVVCFSSKQHLEEYSPDYLVVGSDYRDREVVGSQHSKQVVFFDRIPKYSTTSVLER